jgi:hypothetical protein
MAHVDDPRERGPEAGRRDPARRRGERPDLSAAIRDEGAVIGRLARDADTFGKAADVAFREDCEGSSR